MRLNGAEDFFWLIKDFFLIKCLECGVSNVIWTDSQKTTDINYCPYCGKQIQGIEKI